MIKVFCFSSEKLVRNLRIWLLEEEARWKLSTQNHIKRKWLKCHWVSFLSLSFVTLSCRYTRSSRNAQFGSRKKPCYAKIALVGLYCMIQLTRNSPTNAYIAQKTALRENRVMRNRVMRGLGVWLISTYKKWKVPNKLLDEREWHSNEKK